MYHLLKAVFQNGKQCVLLDSQIGYFELVLKYFLMILHNSMPAQ